MTTIINTILWFICCVSCQCTNTSLYEQTMLGRLSFHIVIFPVRGSLCFCWPSSTGRSEARVECIPPGWCSLWFLTGRQHLTLTDLWSWSHVRFMSLTGELTVVVRACRVFLVRTEGRAGGGAGAEAGVAQGRAHLTGLTAVVDRPLDVQGWGQRGALLGLDAEQEEEKDNG